jgi:Cu(I)/Ag(I) efflux system membrane protein CusA/SilA
MPPLDEGSFLDMPSLLPSGSLSEVQQVLARRDRAMLEVPEVASAVGKFGRAETPLDPAPVGMIETIVLLKPESEWRRFPQEQWHSNLTWLGWARPVLTYFWPEERTITKAEILKELEEKTAIPGVLPSWLQPIQTRIVMLQTGFRAMMGVKVYGSDPKEIERVGLQIEQILKRVPGTANVVADCIVGKPYVQYEIDRAAIARYGVNVRDVQDIIEVAIGGENQTMTVEGANATQQVCATRASARAASTIGPRPGADVRGAHIPIGQVAKVRHGRTAGTQERERSAGRLRHTNARERAEVSVVEEAERLLQAEKPQERRADRRGEGERGDADRAAGLSLGVVGAVRESAAAMRRLLWIMPLVGLSMAVMLYLGLQVGGWCPSSCSASPPRSPAGSPCSSSTGPT